MVVAAWSQPRRSLRFFLDVQWLQTVYIRAPGDVPCIVTPSTSSMSTMSSQPSNSINATAAPTPDGPPKLRPQIARYDAL